MIEIASSNPTAQSPRCRIRIGLATLLGIAFGLLVAIGPAQAKASDEKPLEVYYGAYAMTVQGLDQQDNSYYADFYTWFRWKPATKAQEDMDPSATFEFMNNIERWGLTQTPVYEKPKKLSGGWLTQQFHVQGKFFSPLNLNSYPLDKHELTIEVEDTTSSAKKLVYLPDNAQSKLDDQVKLPGWNITGHQIRIGTHAYKTSFGEKVNPSSDAYSRATFAIAIERPENFFIWKLLLPLVIVMLIAGSILVVHPSLVEVRLAAPVTALLALVFLQQSYSSTLPENGNLVLLDKIYVLAYALLVGLIVTTVLTSLWMRKDEEGLTPRAVRLDHWTAGVLAGTFVLGTGLLIALA